MLAARAKASPKIFRTPVLSEQCVRVDRLEQTGTPHVYVLERGWRAYHAVWQ